MFISGINSINNTNPACRKAFSEASKKISCCNFTFGKDVFSKTPAAPEKGQILDNNGNIYNRSRTYFFRPDIDWRGYADYLDYRFRGFDKINTYIYACNDGSEAYSMSMLLQDKFKNETEKFFPIYAKDINGEIITENITKQKNKNVAISDFMLNIISKKLNNGTKEFIKPDTKEEPASVKHLSSKVLDPVKFSRENILDDIENIDSKTPSIVMCRNMWPYVKGSEYQEFSDKLYEKLASGSCVVIGDFDYMNRNKIAKNLIEAGFKPATYPMGKLKLVFEKN